MNAAGVLEKIQYSQCLGLELKQFDIDSVSCNSQTCGSGTIFFCIEGNTVDGHDFALDAYQRGTRIFVTSRPVDLPQDAGVFIVEDTRIALARAAHRLYDFPTEKLDVVGITGTNGKTTTAYLMDAIFTYMGRKTGVIGTIENKIAGTVIPSTQTTPQSNDLAEMFAGMCKAGVESVSMEVSSHALDQHRIEGIQFRAVGFTNISQDHLDYHANMDEYFKAKKRLFFEVPSLASVINIDSPEGKLLARELQETDKFVLTVSIDPSADLYASKVCQNASGMTFELGYKSYRALVNLPLVGSYNVENALVAAGCALSMGIELESVAKGLSCAPQVPGRLQRIDAGQSFGVFVDYAHTPDALINACNALREITRGRLIVVFGCGGDRDASKRPLMGRAVQNCSDISIVTSDNPRTENPDTIISQVLTGMAQDSDDVIIQADRAVAIRQAVELAKNQDTILIAGKGHEDYQIMGTKKVHFDDREIATKVLENLTEGKL